MFCRTKQTLTTALRQTSTQSCRIGARPIRTASGAHERSRTAGTKAPKEIQDSSNGGTPKTKNTSKQSTQRDPEG